MRLRDVVVIILDDLRPELPAYGCNHTTAPAMTKLAEESVVFRSAYAQQALCAPSRNSFLSGRSPDQTKAWQFIDHFREVGPDWTTLPGAFKRNGYDAVGAGKVFHENLPPYWDMPRSWDDRMNNTSWEEWLYPSEPTCPGNTTWCAVDSQNASDFEDTQISVRLGDLLKNATRPYFLAAGFRKPHLQWRFPKEYLSSQDPGVSPLQTAPIDAPALSFHVPYSEFSRFADVDACGGAGAMGPATPYPVECQIAWRRGYYSSVAFVDAQVGKLLDLISDDDRTIVALFGDHGWHLGDGAEWEKFTNFENSVRVPLMIRAKGLLEPATRSDPVELVDLYPTLAALAGIDISFVANETAPLAGRDLFSSSSSTTVFARSQFPRCVGGENYNDNYYVNRSYPLWYLNDCNDVPRELFTHMGYSIRNETWRFTAWFEWDGDALAPRTQVAIELYNHTDDDGTCGTGAFDVETRNIANAADPKLIRDLNASLCALFDDVCSTS
ncbi:hypothetical protein CTAYLR_007412 [Chrysophaeum taylorii]|uniref:Sulfatase N-terminal domain-containing protein n=1 Tax=Chrysophaeum taylorii TaxID=2483200 RepID=A0AAD7U4E9_9STRA|nr:hypothetical protein CTAYLR_007412 [Chrysophaeum taylorii]